jgi:PAS domain-containing protein
MYENKKLMKPERIVMNPAVAKEVEIPVPEDRKRKLDALFEALLTVVGEGYVYLNDLKYDYSRWAISLVDDFGFESEYVYHAGKIWQNYIHPDDLMPYRQSVDSVVRGKAKVESYSHRVRKPDGTYIVIQPRYFILNDDEGKPEYFGGILVPQ